MKITVKNIVRKIAKITGITIVSFFLLLFLLPYILPNTISTKIKSLVNRSIDGEINFSRARLSFFKHFPALTLSLRDFTLKGSAPLQHDTLLSARDVAFGIDIPSLIRGDIHVNKFFITEGNIHVEVNEKGEANYNVYRSSAKSSSNTEPSADTSTALKIEKIIIEQTNVIYDDRSSNILINARGLDYLGNGDLSKAIFDLTSHLQVDSFDFFYDRQPYILKKKVNADLLTSINTNSLALKFQRNLLHINRLPVEFKGSFDFVSNGYHMDFRLNSKDADLDDVLSAIPPQYQGWLDKTRIRGTANIAVNLTGSYIGSTNTMPTLECDMKVRDGYFAYDKAPVPLSGLHLDLRSQLPGLNMDSLRLDLDSLAFNLEKDHFYSSLHVRGYTFPYIAANVQSDLDLATLHRALGIADYDFRGHLQLQFKADGQYTIGQDSRSLRKHIVITSIPAFSLQSKVSNGYFRYNALPQAIDHLDFDLGIQCADHDYHHTNIALEHIDARAMNNYVKGFLRLKNLNDLPIEANLDALVDLSDIQRFYPLDSLQLAGNMAMNIQSNGSYQPDKKIFPKTEASIKINNASIRTKYYPAPIEQISVEALVHNKQGTLRDLAVDLKPVSFVFEGKPFLLKADLKDFENIRYDIVSKGEIDLGRIYQVFSQKGIDVKGVIETDLALKGSQLDAMAGRYARLSNRGSLKVQDILIQSELYPLPFEIDNGVFRFHQDDMKFETFRARYGKSVINVDGSLSNLFAYLTHTGALKGKFILKSDHLWLDELMAYHADTTAIRTAETTPGSSGVIILPKDLDLQFTADVKNVDYNKLLLKDVKGDVAIKDGELTLTQTGFTMADAVTTMDASYKSLSPARAAFTYHIVINDFDVKKMYQQVELFRELAPAAGKAEGIVSLDYNLDGKLNSEMYPILPALKGNGVISVKKVKMKGFKLFSAMGRETGKDAIKDPDLSKIDFKTSIKNNVVTLERTKMKVAGFRIRLQGQTTLDGKLKLKCRLGLPPLGIIGIPMNVTGTGQNPRIKVGKGDELPLEEQQEEMDDKDN